MAEGAVVGTWWQGFFTYFHPLLLWHWLTGSHGWFFRIYRNIKSGFDPRFRRRRRLLSWVEQAAGRDVLDLATVWRDGSILCEVVHRACPTACQGWEESQSRDTFRHAQALIYRCLQLDPAFSEEELSRTELTPNLDKRLFRYLQAIKLAISKRYHTRSLEEESEGEALIAEEYIARGMGLIMASRRQPAIFYIYSRDGSSLMDIHIEIRGPGEDFGSALVSQVDSDISSDCSIPIEYKVTPEYLRVSYQPRSVGHHELSVSRHGYIVPGSPFVVTVDEITERQPNKRFNSIEWYTEDEERRQKDMKEKKQNAKVKFRVVDFVTEKMILTDDGKLVKISPDIQACTSPPPPDFPAPIPQPPKSLELPPSLSASPTRSCDSRSSSGRSRRSISPKPKNKRTKKCKWVNMKPDAMKYILVKPQRSEVKRVSDAASQVTMEIHENIFQDRCKRIVNVCNYLLRHCPRQKSLEIISGAGHILQTGMPKKNTDCKVRKETLSVTELSDEDDEVFVTSPCLSPTVKTIMNSTRCRSISFSFVNDNLTDSTENITEDLHENTNSERRESQDSGHLASAARRSFRCEGNTKSHQRRVSFSSISAQNDDSTFKCTEDARNNGIVAEESNIGSDVDTNIINKSEITLTINSQIKDEVLQITNIQDNSEKELDKIEISPERVLKTEISDKGNNNLLLPQEYISSHFKLNITENENKINNSNKENHLSPDLSHELNKNDKEPMIKNTGGFLDNCDLSIQRNDTSKSNQHDKTIAKLQFDNKISKRVSKTKGNLVKRIIAHFEANVDSEIEKEKTGLINEASSLLFRENDYKTIKQSYVVSGTNNDIVKEKVIQIEDELQLEYLKSIGASLKCISTVKPKIEMFEKSVKKDPIITSKQTISKDGHSSKDTVLTESLKTPFLEDTRPHVFRAEPAIIVSKHYAELHEISLNKANSTEAISFDFKSDACFGSQKRIESEKKDVAALGVATEVLTNHRCKDNKTKKQYSPMVTTLKYLPQDITKAEVGSSITQSHHSNIKPDSDDIHQHCQTGTRKENSIIAESEGTNHLQRNRSNETQIPCDHHSFKETINSKESSNSYEPNSEEAAKYEPTVAALVNEVPKDPDKQMYWTTQTNRILNTLPLQINIKDSSLNSIKEESIKSVRTNLTNNTYTEDYSVITKGNKLINTVTNNLTSKLEYVKKDSILTKTTNLENIATCVNFDNVVSKKDRAKQTETGHLILSKAEEGTTSDTIGLKKSKSSEFEESNITLREYTDKLAPDNIHQEDKGTTVKELIEEIGLETKPLNEYTEWLPTGNEHQGDIGRTVIELTKEIGLETKPPKEYTEQLPPDNVLQEEIGTTNDLAEEIGLEANPSNEHTEQLPPDNELQENIAATVNELTKDIGLETKPPNEYPEQLPPDNVLQEEIGTTNELAEEIGLEANPSNEHTEQLHPDNELQENISATVNELTKEIALETKTPNEYTEQLPPDNVLVLQEAIGTTNDLDEEIGLEANPSNDHTEQLPPDNELQENISATVNELTKEIALETKTTNEYTEQLPPDNVLVLQEAIGTTNDLAEEIGLEANPSNDHTEQLPPDNELQENIAATVNELTKEVGLKTPPKEYIEKLLADNVLQEELGTTYELAEEIGLEANPSNDHTEQLPPDNELQENIAATVNELTKEVGLKTTPPKEYIEKLLADNVLQEEIGTTNKLAEEIGVEANPPIVHTEQLPPDNEIQENIAATVNELTKEIGLKANPPNEHTEQLPPDNEHQENIADTVNELTKENGLETKPPKEYTEQLPPDNVLLEEIGTTNELAEEIGLEVNPSNDHTEQLPPDNELQENIAATVNELTKEIGLETKPPKEYIEQLLADNVLLEEIGTTNELAEEIGLEANPLSDYTEKLSPDNVHQEDIRSQVNELSEEIVCQTKPPNDHTEQLPPDIVFQDEVGTTNELAEEIVCQTKPPNDHTEQLPPDIVFQEELGTTNELAEEIVCQTKPPNDHTEQLPPDIVFQEEVGTTNELAEEIVCQTKPPNDHTEQLPPDIVFQEEVGTTNELAEEIGLETHPPNKYTEQLPYDNLPQEEIGTSVIEFTEEIGLVTKAHNKFTEKAIPDNVFQEDRTTSVTELFEEIVFEQKLLNEYTEVLSTGNEYQGDGTTIVNELIEEIDSETKPANEYTEQLPPDNLLLGNIGTTVNELSQEILCETNPYNEYTEQLPPEDALQEEIGTTNELTEEIGSEANPLSDHTKQSNHDNVLQEEIGTSLNELTKEIALETNPMGNKYTELLLHDNVFQEEVGITISKLTDEIGLETESHNESTEKSIPDDVFQEDISTIVNEITKEIKFKTKPHSEYTDQIPSNNMLQEDIGTPVNELTNEIGSETNSPTEYMEWLPSDNELQGDMRPTINTEQLPPNNVCHEEKGNIINELSELTGLETNLPNEYMEHIPPDNVLQEDIGIKINEETKEISLETKPHNEYTDQIPYDNVLHEEMGTPVNKLTKEIGFETQAPNEYTGRLPSDNEFRGDTRPTINTDQLPHNNVCHKVKGNIINELAKLTGLETNLPNEYMEHILPHNVLQEDIGIKINELTEEIYLETKPRNEYMEQSPSDNVLQEEIDTTNKIAEEIGLEANRPIELTDQLPPVNELQENIGTVVSELIEEIGLETKSLNEYIEQLPPYNLFHKDIGTTKNELYEEIVSETNSLNEYMERLPSDNELQGDMRPTINTDQLPPNNVCHEEKGNTIKELAELTGLETNLHNEYMELIPPHNVLQEDTGLKINELTEEICLETKPPNEYMEQSPSDNALQEEIGTTHEIADEIGLEANFPSNYTAQFRPENLLQENIGTVVSELIEEISLETKSLNEYIEQLPPYNLFQKEIGTTKNELFEEIGLEMNPPNEYMEHLPPNNVDQEDIGTTVIELIEEIVLETKPTNYINQNETETSKPHNANLSVNMSLKDLVQSEATTVTTDNTFVESSSNLLATNEVARSNGLDVLFLNYTKSLTEEPYKINENTPLTLLERENAKLANNETEESESQQLLSSVIISESEETYVENGTDHIIIPTKTPEEVSLHITHELSTEYAMDVFSSNDLSTENTKTCKDLIEEDLVESKRTRKNSSETVISNNILEEVIQTPITEGGEKCSIEVEPFSNVVIKNKDVINNINKQKGSIFISEDELLGEKAKMGTTIATDEPSIEDIQKIYIVKDGSHAFKSEIVQEECSKVKSPNKIIADGTGVTIIEKPITDSGLVIEIATTTVPMVISENNLQNKEIEVINIFTEELGSDDITEKVMAQAGRGKPILNEPYPDEIISETADKNFGKTLSESFLDTNLNSSPKLNELMEEPGSKVVPSYNITRGDLESAVIKVTDEGDSHTMSCSKDKKTKEKNTDPSMLANQLYLDDSSKDKVTEEDQNTDTNELTQGDRGLKASTNTVGVENCSEDTLKEDTKSNVNDHFAKSSSDFLLQNKNISEKTEIIELIIDAGSEDIPTNHGLKEGKETISEDVIDFDLLPDYTRKGITDVIDTSSDWLPENNIAEEDKKHVLSELTEDFGSETVIVKGVKEDIMSEVSKVWNTDSTVLSSNNMNMKDINNGNEEIGSSIFFTEEILFSEEEMIIHNVFQEKPDSEVVPANELVEVTRMLDEEAFSKLTSTHLATDQLIMEHNSDMLILKDTNSKDSKSILNNTTEVIGPELEVTEPAIGEDTEVSSLVVDSFSNSVIKSNTKTVENYEMGSTFMLVDKALSREMDIDVNILQDDSSLINVSANDFVEEGKDFISSAINTEAFLEVKLTDELVEKESETCMETLITKSVLNAEVNTTKDSATVVEETNSEFLPLNTTSNIQELPINGHVEKLLKEETYDVSNELPNEPYLELLSTRSTIREDTVTLIEKSAVETDSDVLPINDITEKDYPIHEVAQDITSNPSIMMVNDGVRDITESTLIDYAEDSPSADIPSTNSGPKDKSTVIDDISQETESIVIDESKILDKESETEGPGSEDLPTTGVIGEGDAISRLDIKEENIQEPSINIMTGATSSEATYVTDATEMSTDCSQVLTNSFITGKGENTQFYKNKTPTEDSADVLLNDKVEESSKHTTNVLKDYEEAVKSTQSTDETGQCFKPSNTVPIETEENDITKYTNRNSLDNISVQKFLKEETYCVSNKLPNQSNFELLSPHYDTREKTDILIEQSASETYSDVSPTSDMTEKGGTSLITELTMKDSSSDPVIVNDSVRDIPNTSIIDNDKDSGSAIISCTNTDPEDKSSIVNNVSKEKDTTFIVESKILDKETKTEEAGSLDLPAIDILEDGTAISELVIKSSSKVTSLNNLTGDKVDVLVKLGTNTGLGIQVNTMKACNELIEELGSEVDPLNNIINQEQPEFSTNVATEDGTSLLEEINKITNNVVIATGTDTLARDLISEENTNNLKGPEPPIINKVVEESIPNYISINDEFKGKNNIITFETSEKTCSDLTTLPGVEIKAMETLLSKSTNESALECSLLQFDLKESTENVQCKTAKDGGSEFSSSVKETNDITVEGLTLETTNIVLTTDVILDENEKNFLNVLTNDNDSGIITLNNTTGEIMETNNREGAKESGSEVIPFTTLLVKNLAAGNTESVETNTNTFEDEILGKEAKPIIDILVKEPVTEVIPINAMFQEIVTKESIREHKTNQKLNNIALEISETTLGTDIEDSDSEFIYSTNTKDMGDTINNLSKGSSSIFLVKNEIVGIGVTSDIDILTKEPVSEDIPINYMGREDNDIPELVKEDCSEIMSLNETAREDSDTEKTITDTALSQNAEESRSETIPSRNEFIKKTETVSISLTEEINSNIIFEDEAMGMEAKPVINVVYNESEDISEVVQEDTNTGIKELVKDVFSKVMSSKETIKEDTDATLSTFSDSAKTSKDITSTKDTEESYSATVPSTANITNNTAEEGKDTQAMDILYKEPVSEDIKDEVQENTNAGINELVKEVYSQVVSSKTTTREDTDVTLEKFRNSAKASKEIILTDNTEESFLDIVLSTTTGNKIVEESTDTDASKSLIEVCPKQLSPKKVKRKETDILIDQINNTEIMITKKALLTENSNANEFQHLQSTTNVANKHMEKANTNQSEEISSDDIFETKSEDTEADMIKLTKATCSEDMPNHMVKDVTERVVEKLHKESDPGDMSKTDEVQVITDLLIGESTIEKRLEFDILLSNELTEEAVKNIAKEDTNTTVNEIAEDIGSEGLPSVDIAMKCADTPSDICFVAADSEYIPPNSITKEGEPNKLLQNSFMCTPTEETFTNTNSSDKNVLPTEQFVAKIKSDTGNILEICSKDKNNVLEGTSKEFVQEENEIKQRNVSNQKLSITPQIEYLCPDLVQEELYKSEEGLEGENIARSYTERVGNSNSKELNSFGIIDGSTSASIDKRFAEGLTATEAVLTTNNSIIACDNLKSHTKTDDSLEHSIFTPLLHNSTLPLLSSNNDIFQDSQTDRFTNMIHNNENLTKGKSIEGESSVSLTEDILNNKENNHPFAARDLYLQLIRNINTPAFKNNNEHESLHSFSHKPEKFKNTDFYCAKSNFTTQTTSKLCEFKQPYDLQSAIDQTHNMPDTDAHKMHVKQHSNIATQIKRFIFADSNEYTVNNENFQVDNKLGSEQDPFCFLTSFNTINSNKLYQTSEHFFEIPESPEPGILSSATLNKLQKPTSNDLSTIQVMKQRFEKPSSEMYIKNVSVNDSTHPIEVKVPISLKSDKNDIESLSGNNQNEDIRVHNYSGIKTIWENDEHLAPVQTKQFDPKVSYIRQEYIECLNSSESLFFNSKEHETVLEDTKILSEMHTNESIERVPSVESEMLNKNLITVEQELSEVLNTATEEIDSEFHLEINGTVSQDSHSMRFKDKSDKEYTKVFLEVDEDQADVLSIEDETIDLDLQQEITDIESLPNSDIQGNIEGSVFPKSKKLIRVDSFLLHLDSSDSEIEEENLCEQSIEVPLVITQMEEYKMLNVEFKQKSPKALCVVKPSSILVDPNLNDTSLIDDEELDEDLQKELDDIDNMVQANPTDESERGSVELSSSAIGFFSTNQDDKDEQSDISGTSKYVLGTSTGFNVQDTRNYQHDMNNYEFFKSSSSYLHCSKSANNHHTHRNGFGSLEPSFDSLQSELSDAGESFSDKLALFNETNLSMSTESDGSDFNAWSSNVEFGDPTETTVKEGMDFDSIISAPNLSEALKKLEAHIQDRGEDIQWLTVRTPSPSLQSLEKYFKEGVSCFDTEKFYDEVSGGLLPEKSDKDCRTSIEKTTCYTVEDAKTTPQEELLECSYPPGSIEATECDRGSQENESDNWIISPFQYPRVLLINTDQMSIIVEEDDQRKSQPPSPLQKGSQDIPFSNEQSIEESESDKNFNQTGSKCYVENEKREIDHTLEEFDRLISRPSVDESISLLKDSSEENLNKLIITDEAAKHKTTQFYPTFDYIVKDDQEKTCNNNITTLSLQNEQLQYCEGDQRNVEIVRNAQTFSNLNDVDSDYFHSKPVQKESCYMQQENNVQEEIKSLLEGNIDCISEDNLNKFSVTERTTFWDRKLQRIQELDTKIVSSLGPKSLSNIKSGTVQELVSCFAENRESLAPSLLIPKSQYSFTKTAGQEKLCQVIDDNQTHEEYITKIMRSPLKECTDDEIILSVKPVSQWKSYWDDIITEQNMSSQKDTNKLSKIPSIQISEGGDNNPDSALNEPLKCSNNEVLYSTISSSDYERGLHEEKDTSDNVLNETSFTGSVLRNIKIFCESSFPAHSPNVEQFNECKSKDSCLDTITDDENKSNSTNKASLLEPMFRTRSYSTGHLNTNITVSKEYTEKNIQETKSYEDVSIGQQNEVKIRFERAKHFFKQLETLAPNESKEQNYRSMPRLDLALPTNRKQSIDSDSGADIKPQKRRDRYRNRRKKRKISSNIQSAPTSDTETAKRVQSKDSFDSFGGSVKSSKVSERFHVKDLFRDVSGKVGLFRGIPNRAAVLASLMSVDGLERPLSPYHMDFIDPKSASLGNIPAGFQNEYPYLPTTPANQYRPRSALEFNLIPRSQLIDEDF